MTRDEIIKKVKEDNVDLDEHVHELKAQEAANINNEGVESQIDYMLEKGGHEWVESLLSQDVKA
jgi:hypothetical protein